MGTILAKTTTFDDRETSWSTVALFATRTRLRNTRKHPPKKKHPSATHSVSCHSTIILYLPMQNRLNTLSRTSSATSSPDTSPSAIAADLRSTVQQS